MNNLPKDNTENNQGSKEQVGSDIYTPPESTNAPSGESTDLYSAQLTPENYSETQDQSQVTSSQEVVAPPAEGSIPPPPPYEERSKIKLLAIIGGVLLILLIIFFGIKFLLGRGGQSPKSATLNYWGLWEEETVIKPLIDEFQKSNPKVKISYTKQNPKQYRERLQAALTRGEGPDLFRFHNTWTDMFLSDLDPIPQTIYTPKEFDQIFYPIAKDDLLRGSSYYGVPLEIDGLVLLYNEDIVKAAGVTSIPQNWEDFRNTALKLTVKDTNGTIQTAGVALGSANNIEHFSDILGLMFLQNGTNLKDPLGPCLDPSITTCAPDTLLFYRKFADPPNNTWDDSMDNSIIAFAGGRVAMIFAPSWQIFTIKQINPDLNLKVAQVPQLPGVTLNWATYWVEGVSKRSKNKDAAWEFLKFLSSKESLAKLYTEQTKTRSFGEPYSRVELASTLSSDPYLSILINEAKTMKSFPLASNTQDNGINDQMIKYLLDAVNSLKEGGNPESALNTAAAGFTQVLQKYGVLAAPPTAAPE